MGLRSRGKQLSFEILSSPKVASVDGDHPHAIAIPTHWSSDPCPVTGDKRNRRRRKHKKPKRNEKLPNSMPSTSNPIADSDFLSADDRNDEFEWSSSCYDHRFVREESTGTVCEGLYGELRQRSVNGGSVDDCEKEVVENEKEQMISRPNPSVELNARLKSEESLEWKRFMADDPIYPLPAETSPIKYFMEEMYSGYSLKSTTTFGSEKERERVYDTIFRLPWRCELLIDVGFFVCFISFLSLLTIMPMRALMMLWRLITRRQLEKPLPAELSDFGCLTGLAGGVALLECTDISLIYHMIRGQGTIKLYVVYNVLEAITLSTCIVAHNNALLALLVSNNFAEIKSNVFKRFSKDNIHSIVYSDSIERFRLQHFCYLF